MSIDCISLKKQSFSEEGSCKTKEGNFKYRNHEIALRAFVSLPPPIDSFHRTFRYIAAIRDHVKMCMREIRLIYRDVEMYNSAHLQTSRGHSNTISFIKSKTDW